MSENDVKDVIRQYLKDNMTVTVDVKGPSTYIKGKKGVEINVSIYLGEELITDYTACL